MMPWTPFLAIPTPEQPEANMAWYFCDDRQVLSAPFKDHDSCKEAIRGAKQEFPRS